MPNRYSTISFVSIHVRMSGTGTPRRRARRAPSRRRRCRARSCSAAAATPRTKPAQVVAHESPAEAAEGAPGVLVRLPVRHSRRASCCSIASGLLESFDRGQARERPVAAGETEEQSAPAARPIGAPAAAPASVPRASIRPWSMMPIVSASSSAIESRCGGHQHGHPRPGLSQEHVLDDPAHFADRGRPAAHRRSGPSGRAPGPTRRPPAASSHASSSRTARRCTRPSRTSRSARRSAGWRTTAPCRTSRRRT